MITASFLFRVPYGSAFGLAGVLGISPDGGILRWVVAVVGAIILIAILKALNVFR